MGRVDAPSSALSDVSNVFDEPSTGLHPHDVHRLFELLADLGDAHNTVLVVEHHPGVIDAADHIIDLGPGSGVHGGVVQYEGSPAGLAATETETGRMLRTPLRLRQQAMAASGADACGARFGTAENRATESNTTVICQRTPRALGLRAKPQLRVQPGLLRCG